jgi:hypothetical protein
MTSIRLRPGRHSAVLSRTRHRRRVVRCRCHASTVGVQRAAVTGPREADTERGHTARGDNKQGSSHISRRYLGASGAILRPLIGDCWPSCGCASSAVPTQDAGVKSADCPPNDPDRPGRRSGSGPVGVPVEVQPCPGGTRLIAEPPRDIHRLLADISCGVGVPTLSRTG